MKTCFKMLFLVFLLCLQASAQELPVEVRRFLENYTKDSTAQWGPIDARSAGRFSSESVRIKDLRVGRVIEIYQLRHTFLDKYPDTVPFSEIIESTKHWLVLITAYNQPLYELLLRNPGGKPEFFGMRSLPIGSRRREMWDLLLKGYPEATKINPIFFSRFGFTVGSREAIFYFPQKGPRKIYFIGPRFDEDPLNTLLSNSINVLDDSKILIEYWKKLGLNEVGTLGYNRATTGGGK